MLGSAGSGKTHAYHSFKDKERENKKKLEQSTELEEMKKGRKLPKYEYKWENKNFNEMTFLSIIQKIIYIFPFFVIVIDEDHNILLANDKVLNATGKNIEDIKGCYCPKAIHGIDEPFPGCPLEEAIEKGHYIDKDLLSLIERKLLTITKQDLIEQAKKVKDFLDGLNKLSRKTKIYIDSHSFSLTDEKQPVCEEVTFDDETQRYKIS